MIENDIYCQSRKQTLIEELIAGTNESPDIYKDFSLNQLDQFKARITSNKQQSQPQQTQHSVTNSGKTFTIGNSIFNKRINEL